MFLPGMDTFTVTPPISHAIFALHEAIPAECDRIQVDFDEPGADITLALRADGSVSDVSVELSNEQRAAAGLLMEYTSYQLHVLTQIAQKDGDDAVFAAQGRFRDSLAQFGLCLGLLDETLVDTITISRQ